MQQSLHDDLAAGASEAMKELKKKREELAVDPSLKRYVQSLAPSSIARPCGISSDMLSR